MLGVVTTGGFSEAGLAHVQAQIRHSCACLGNPVVALRGPEALREAVVGSWTHYLDDGTRWVQDRGPVEIGWDSRDPEARSAGHAIARAVSNGRSARQPALLLSFAGDEAPDADRAWARAVAEDEWRCGTLARAEMVGDAEQTVWLDTETTGKAPNICGVIEVGAVACDSGSRKLRGQFELRLRIERWAHVEPQALQVNGYDPTRWQREAFGHDDGMALLAAWMPCKFKLAAYNVSFDRSVIRNAFLRAGQDEPGWREDTIDPLPMVRRYLKRGNWTKSAKLTEACEFFGIDTSLAHTALADAWYARLLYLALMGDDIGQYVAEMGL